MKNYEPTEKEENEAAELCDCEGLYICPRHYRESLQDYKNKIMKQRESK